MRPNPLQTQQENAEQEHFPIDDPDSANARALPVFDLRKI
jgi:hypothetical protein